MSDVIPDDVRVRRGRGGGLPSWGALLARPALVLGLALAVAACNGDASGSGSPADPAGPTSGNSGTGGPGADPDATPVPPPRPSRVDPVAGRAEREVPWRLVRGGPDDRTLLLEVQVGGPPCDAITGVRVDERRASVVVTVVAGRVRGARCGPGVRAILGTFRVAATLDARLGDRKLVDGAR